MKENISYNETVIKNLLIFIKLTRTTQTIIIVCCETQGTN